MTLYCNEHNYFSHQARIVLSEKAVPFDRVEILDEKDMPGLQELSPHASVPTLVDRDLVLYEPRIILEYLDERFPHPPLLPVYPVARANTRLMMLRIERDWYHLARQIETTDGKIADRARRELKDLLVSVSPLFENNLYCLSEDYSLVDCCLAPLLWRLPRLKLKLPEEAKPIMTYARRLFSRPAFKASVTGDSYVHHEL
ncbi:MAG: glutathione S-transferase N-terminal domain-containing protein [Pseudomonadota bacterium]